MEKYGIIAFLFFIAIGSVITIIGIGLTAGGEALNTRTSADIIHLRGSEKIIHYPGEQCSKITFGNLSPFQAFANLTTTDRDSIRETKQNSLILVDHTLRVGFNPNQLSYYGLPVEVGDRVSLMVISSQNNTGVDISVYDSNGFSFLNQGLQASAIRSYTLDESCLEASGCNTSITLGFKGWVYFVFTSSPTPSEFIVSIRATTRSYSPSNQWNSCTIRPNSECSKATPTKTTYYLATYYTNERGGGEKKTTVKKRVEHLPFSVIYGSNDQLPLTSNPVQSLNISTSLYWKCPLDDNKLALFISGLVILVICVGCTLAVGIGCIVFICFLYCGKEDLTENNLENAEHNKDITDSSQVDKPNMKTNVEPPSYAEVQKTSDF